MAVTRAWLESLSHSQDQLVDRLLSVKNVSQQMNNLIKRLDKVINKCEELDSELVVAINVSVYQKGDHWS